MIAFRSLLAPLRLIFEIILVLIFFYGVNTLIFQEAHMNGDDALFWATIFIMFNISVGLCCDYDIFSFNAMYIEANNMLKTGEFDIHRVITAGGENVLIVLAAGLIVSFSGLLFSSLDMLL